MLKAWIAALGIAMDNMIEMNALTFVIFNIRCTS
jgi:hypothetical protein